MSLSIEYLVDHKEAIRRIARWHYEQWVEISPEVGVDLRAARFAACAARGGIPTGFVAVSGGVVVGVACLVAQDLETHSHLSPWLASVLVKPTHRRSGIGSALSRRVVEEARVLGYDCLHLFTFDQAGFYERLGWSIVESARFKGRPVTVMSVRVAG